MRTLPAASPSLALARPEASPPGTLSMLGAHGGVVVQAQLGATVSFGRNLPEVDVAVGLGDERVSRRHGVLICTGRRWNLRTLGRLPIRLSNSRLVFADAEPVELPEGYTPAFIKSPSGREHVLEIRITGRHPVESGRPDARTNTAPRWTLSTEEQLVLVVLGQRYLRHEEYPQPLSWRQAADTLQGLHPEQGWTAKRAEHIGVAVRKRLSNAGIPGLTRDEVGDPVGNALNHNLLIELVASAVLVPPDLRVLDELP